jgi:hypothetical protein
MEERTGYRPNRLQRQTVDAVAYIIGVCHLGDQLQILDGLPANFQFAVVRARKRRAGNFMPARRE